MDKKRTFFGQVSSRLTGINDKRKEIFFLWCLLVGLILISSKIFGGNRELKAKLKGLEVENQLLEKQNKEQEKTNFLIKEENSFFSERLKIVYTTEYIEEKMEERLQKRYGSELKIVGCYPCLLYTSPSPRDCS